MQRINIQLYPTFEKSRNMKNVGLIFLLSVSISCSSQNTNTYTLESNEFEKGISQADIQVLDVRTATEFKTGHIKNALQADWTDKTQFSDRIQYVDKHKPVYIYCLIGGRSAAAAGWMRKNGFENVYELKGGISAWKKDGKPVEGQSTEPQITLEEYNKSIPADKTVLVDFGATWCPPCVKMAPVLDELQKDKDLKFILVKIDAGVQTQLMKELNVEPLPTFIVYKKGKEKWRKSGVVDKKELEKELK